MPKTADRRRFWRTVFHSPVALRDETGTGNAELIDISLSGALVELPSGRQVAAGAACELQLTLADDVQIAMRASVVHVEGQRLGLRCNDIDLESMTHLRRLVELNLGDPALLQRELPALMRDNLRTS